MAKESSLQKRLGLERARALAIICLTRRTDLIVRDEAADIGVDLLVSVHSEHTFGLRFFGVKLRSGWAAKTAESANAGLRPSMKKMLRYGPFPLPVALFLFTMEDNRGWYTWVAEPATDAAGIAKLRQHDEAHCQPLVEHAVDEIVESVNRWYDARFTTNGRETEPKSASGFRAAGAVKWPATSSQAVASAPEQAKGSSPRPLITVRSRLKCQDTNGQWRTANLAPFKEQLRDHQRYGTLTRTAACCSRGRAARAGRTRPSGIRRSPCAACRPSAMAQTIRLCPRVMSPAVNTFGTLVPLLRHQP